MTFQPRAHSSHGPEKRMEDMEFKKTWPVMSLAEAHALLTSPGAPYEMDEVVIRGVATRTWKNVPPTLRDLFLLGRSFGPRTFVVYENDRATYEAFARAALAFAAELQRQGVKKGDRVALAMRNLPEWPVVFFAAVLTGAIVTPLNAWWSGPELEYGLNDFLEPKWRSLTQSAMTVSLLILKIAQVSVVSSWLAKRVQMPREGFTIQGLSGSKMSSGR